MGKKRVLIFSEGFGTGHTQAAHALAVSLRQSDPNIQTRVFELGSFLNPTVAPWILSAYKKTITSKPKIIGMVYRFYQSKKSLNRITQLALHRIFYTQTANMIKQLKPDAVVCTHPFPSIVISRLKRTGLQVPLCTVITDYDAHGAWINEEVNKYLVSTPEVKQKLISSGVPLHRIQVTGIPVHPDFWKSYNRDEITIEFNLANLPTVLVMGGGWGLMDDEQLYFTVSKWREKLQFIFCLGNNEKSRQKLLNIPSFRHPHIHILGYTKEINKLMEVSDLLITKPGGMTCTEALAKRIPMLFYKPLPGQEEDNCQYFVDQGFGQIISSHETLENSLQSLLQHYQEMRKRRTWFTNHPVKYNPKTCSQAIIQILK